MRRRIGALIVLGAVLSVSCGGSTVPTTTAVARLETSTGSACAGIDPRPRSVVYEASGAGEISPAAPATLGPAVAAVPAGLFTGVRYAGCSAEVVAGLASETMAWTNGIGSLHVSWQQWPDDGDPVVLPFGGATHQAGVVQVSLMDEMLDERTRVAVLFDGVRVITVATFSLTTLSVEQAEEIAWGVYDAIPVRELDRPGVGASPGMAGLLAELPTDGGSVGEVAGTDQISPFTATMSMPVASYEVVVAGNVLRVFDFGAPGAADRAEAAVSRDGYTIAHEPYDVSGTPRFWRWGRLIVLYTGSDDVLLTRLGEVLGLPFAGAEFVEPE